MYNLLLSEGEQYVQVADDDSDKLAVRVHIGRNPFQLFISDVTAHLRDDVVIYLQLILTCYLGRIAKLSVSGTTSQLLS